MNDRVVVPEYELELRRARHRLNTFDDTLDRFVRISTEANGSACATEEAKLRYVASLSPKLRADLGY